MASYGAVLNKEIKLLSINGTTINSIFCEGLPSGLSSIWFKPGKKYYIVGDGVYQTNKLGKIWQPDTTHPRIYKTAIRGQDENDIFITGSFGLVSHFNGFTWHHYTGKELPYIYGGYWSISYKSNIMVAVGDIDDRAIILLGRKSN